jgi:hypothetical protein
VKTLKYDEVHRQEYRDLAEARASISHFLEQVYNHASYFVTGVTKSLSSYGVTESLSNSTPYGAPCFARRNVK